MITGMPSGRSFAGFAAFGNRRAAGVRWSGRVPRRVAGGRWPALSRVTIAAEAGRCCRAVVREVVARVLQGVRIDRLVATSTDSIHIPGPGRAPRAVLDPGGSVTSGRVTSVTRPRYRSHSARSRTRRRLVSTHRIRWASRSHRRSHAQPGCHIWGREGTRRWPPGSACPAWSSCQPTTRPAQRRPAAHHEEIGSHAVHQHGHDHPQKAGRVFAYLAHFENLPRWNYAISDTRKTSSGPVGVGSRYGRPGPFPPEAKRPSR